MHVHSKFVLPAVIAVLGLTLAGCAPTSSDASGPSTNGAGLPAVDVSIITSQTGPLAAYGATYLAGWDAGLDYATQGTGTVDGRAVNVTIADDAGDVDKAVTAAKTVIGQGKKIIVGTASSGIALALAEQAEQNKILYISGPAAADGVTGINAHTFRSGRQSYQDVATAGTFIGDPKGKSILVFAQNTAFGQGNVAAATAVLGAKGATVTSLLVPEDATEFTPFAQQIINATPDMVFVAWAGATSAAMWESLSQQGVFDKVPVVTGLGNVATYGAYGAASSKISFLNHYFAGATDNAVNTAMIASLTKSGAVADLFSPDGFNAAVMVVQAIRAGGGDDVAKMITSLEGWTFDGPKGSMTIRAEDHAMIQPMFQVKLVADGANWKPELVDVVDAQVVTPPIVQK
ncbi:substrate-binding domain-containing protein [Alpinimonas psychrophila]|uniref:Branched-chain amino acid transport system substrate-binding protein n=1 Tax=Alpinimonas psychrophila TaxID=748908 RepID=A0A7W3JT95_9MICO|nr:substrate-binding domain-containing protein [Alpinimonas psychrophila]MBA8828816.1 branched-chain amino acid transport system substrate-binding protein [Alpinimonas psychrophila]